jgi:hypothetical protein
MMDSQLVTVIFVYFLTQFVELLDLIGVYLIVYLVKFVVCFHLGWYGGLQMRLKRVNCGHKTKYELWKVYGQSNKTIACLVITILPKSTYICFFSVAWLADKIFFFCGGNHLTDPLTFDDSITLCLANWLYILR